MKLFFLSVLVYLVLMSSDDSVHLSEIKVLTLHKNRWTKSSRTDPILQLNCKKGCSSYLPDVVQCTNVGFDGNEYQWKCESDMEEKYNFDGGVEVSCEGFEKPGDQNVLKGSCGLYFSIKEVESPSTETTTTTTTYGDGDYDYYDDGWSEFVSIIGIIVGIIVLIIVIGYFCGDGISRAGRRTHSYHSPGHSTTHHYHHHGGGGWWGGSRWGNGFSLGYLLGNRGNRGSRWGRTRTVRRTNRTTSSNSSSSRSSGSSRSRTSYGGTKSR